MTKKNALGIYRKLFSRKIYILLSVILLVAISFTFVGKYVTAQNAGQGLTVSPPTQEATVDPGGTTVIKAKLRNDGNNTLPIQVHIEDFTAQGSGGEVQLNANSPYSIASWSKVTPTNFQLAPGEEQEVTATITAPKNSAGGHYGSFVFGVVPDKTPGNSAALSQEIASLFLVRVSGPVNEKLTLKGMSAPAYSEFGPVPMMLDFVNEGNVHVKTFGLVNVRDMFGNKVADVVVTGTEVFPGAERVVQAQLNNRFLIGNYTATAIMYYGSQNQSLTDETSFFVFPTRIAVIILVILVILYLMRKRFKKASKALFGK